MGLKGARRPGRPRGLLSGSLGRVPWQGSWVWGITSQSLQVTPSPALFHSCRHHKGPESPEDPTTEPPGGAATLQGAPRSCLCTFAHTVPPAVLVFLSHSLSPAGPVILRFNSSGKPSQMARPLLNSQFGNFPPCAVCLATVLLPARLLFLLGPPMKPQTPQEEGPYLSFLLYLHEPAPQNRNQEVQHRVTGAGLAHDHKPSGPSPPVCLCSLETR